MSYLYELTLENRELIEKKLAELWADELYLNSGCSSKEDFKSTLNLLSSLYFELLSSKERSKITEELYIKRIQSLKAIENDYRVLIDILNNIKSIVRDIVFVKAQDNTQLYHCIVLNDECCSLLQTLICDQSEKPDCKYGVLGNTFELMPFGVFICEEGRFAYANTAVERLTGYANAELCSMNISELLHSDFIHILNDSQELRNIDNPSGIRRYECKILNRNGHEIWVDISVGRAETDSNKIIGTAVDVTERKKIEKKLNKSESKYRTFFNFSPDMIYMADLKSGLIEEANPMTLNTLGVTLAEIRFMRLRDFYAGDSLDEVKQAFADLLNGNELKGLDIKVKNISGEIFDFEVNCTPIAENDQVVKVLCLARNVTERKKIDEFKKQAYDSIKLLNETLEYDKLKTEFFANLSHELRTPLNVILGTLQVMDMFNYDDPNFTDEKVKRYSKIMRQNCYRLLRLVNNLIDLNRLDTGYLKATLDNHDIVSIVTQIVASVADYIESKGINFTFETKADSKVIACDPDKMERIILNLLSNAIKFTESGGNIQVKLWEEQNRLLISVKDTGTGIPKDKQDLVFKRFVQLDKSLSRNHQGSGIGLSLVKSLVELHDGSIRLVSEEGVGSEFIIELPVKQVLLQEKGGQYNQGLENNKIETINIEFADIYS